MYAEIRQAHIVLLFFQYFADLSFLIILGGVCGGVVSKQNLYICVNTYTDTQSQLKKTKRDLDALFSSQLLYQGKT